jgi:hypothetical protein
MFFPNNFTDFSVITAGREGESVGSDVWKRNIITGLATEGKGRQFVTKRYHKNGSIHDGDSGDYDYDDHYHINTLAATATAYEPRPLANWHHLLLYSSCKDVGYNTCAVVLFRHKPDGGQQCDWSYRISKLLIASDLVQNL